MSHCPSCGRYVGPCEACPYCGSRLTGRISIRIVKIAALAFATVGLAILWLAATRAEVPLIEIREAGATTNMAYVRLAGRCTRASTYDPEGEYLSFWIADDTGEMRVSTYRAETRQIIAQSRVPALGDLVEVAGTLRVREDFLSLTVNVPEHLKITRADPVDRDIGTIGPADQYLRVRVRGQVRAISEPYPGLALVTVRDGSGSIPVAVSEDLVALSGASPSLMPGQPVEVVAAVSLYRDTPQLVPASVADIVPLSQTVPVAIERQIGALTTADVGQLALVRGTVTNVNPFSSGVKLTLDDDTGTVLALLWSSVYEALPDPAALAVGAQVQVQGEFSQYRGALELVPELAEDVRVLATAPPPPRPTATPTPTPLPPPAVTAQPTEVLLPTGLSTLGPGATPADTPVPEESPTPEPTTDPRRSDVIAIETITPAQVGQEVTVEGTVVGTASFSSGFKFTLDDGTGRIVLLMWHDVYDDCWDAPEINLGATVRATGVVAQYEGELQIQPDFGGDVKAVEGAAAWAAAREIGSLSGGDEGQRVMIEGQVIRVEGQRSAVNVFVGDDTGETLVFIWRTVLDRIAGNTALGTPGSRVRVVGLVEVYRGNLEIVPTLPNDVLVLQ